MLFDEDNNYIEMQILNQIQMSENFKTTCRLASQQDDGVIDTDEKKILERIYKESIFLCIERLSKVGIVP